ncbi:MAG: archaeosortase/exosortase family protein [Candidatus Aenigmarchaeota archaeon]|nr:archaeosortase/exosortase family protein [Candidatus Aenigmarchaeota archaeon]
MDLPKDLGSRFGFLARLNAFALPFYAIELTGAQFTWFMEVTERISFIIMQATGLPVIIENGLMAIPVNGGTWAAYVSWDSSGWKSLLVLFALVMATGAPLNKRIAGLLLLPVLYVFNIARIWFMFFFVGSFGLEHYGLVHGTLWSWGTAAALLAMWLLWKRWAENGLVKTGHDRAGIPRSTDAPLLRVMKKTINTAR